MNYAVDTSKLNLGLPSFITLDAPFPEVDVINQPLLKTTTQ